MICLFYLMVFFLFLYSIIKIRKRSFFFDVLFIAIVSFIFYISTNSIDSGSYELFFRDTNILSLSKDAGFVLFINLCKIFTQDYAIFRMIVGLLSAIVIVFIVNGLTINWKSKYLVYATYLIYPFIQGVIALRMTLAINFILLGFYFYFKSKKKRIDKIILLVSVLIAAQFHSLCYIFIFILIIYFFVKKTKYYFILFFGILIAIIFLKFYSASLFNMISMFLSTSDSFSKYNLYTSSIEGLGIGFIIPIFVQLIELLFLYVSFKYSKKTSNIINNEIFKLNLALLFLSPFYIINTLFLRLYRSVLVFNYITISDNIKKEKINFQLVFTILYIIFNIALLLWDADGYNSIISIFSSL